MEFRTGGPQRYAHQRQALRRIIETGGVCALLMDPGTGKTPVALDYASLLAHAAAAGRWHADGPGMPPGAHEARVLVLGPLVTVDTWVSSAAQFVSPDVDFWAEALGGSIPERIEALASRGGAPFPAPLAAGKRVVKDLDRWAPPPDSPRLQHVGRSLDHAARFAAPATATAPLSHDPASPLPAYPPALYGPQNGSGAPQRPRLMLEVVNLDTLSSRQPVGSRTMADLFMEAVKRYAPDLVIVDESHLLKSPGSNTSRLAQRLGRLVRRRLILTGTVAPHSPLDVYAQWRFLAPLAFSVPDVKRAPTPAYPKPRKPMTRADFEEHFAVFGGHFGKQIVGFKRLDEMNATMAQNSIVVSKDEALDLPPTQEVIIPVILSYGEFRAYSDLRKKLRTQVQHTTDEGAQVTVDNTLTQALRLRQITAGHLPDDAGTVRTVGSSKVNTIASLVNDTLAGESRVVIFGVFRHEIAELSRALAVKGTTVETVTGDTPPAERIAVRRRFGDTAAHPGRIVLVAQIATMSLSVNELVTASHAVFASLSTQRDQFEQAKDRLNRIGQTRPVTFWLALAPGTVDEVIYDSHRQRRSLEAAILAHLTDDDDDMTSR